MLGQFQCHFVDLGNVFVNPCFLSMRNFQSLTVATAFLSKKGARKRRLQRPKV